MSERTTKREVEAVFERLCQTVGVPACHAGNSSSYYRDADGAIHHVKGWSLDYNSAYGGWVIAGHSGTGTGESRPLGEYRMSSRQFVQAMHFAISALGCSQGWQA